MPKSAKSLSWQHMRRLLASRSKNELLDLIRDLYALTTANKDFIYAQVLTPKPKAPKTRQPKQPPSSTAKVVPKIRQLARIARELHEGASFKITRLTTLKSLCGDATAAARFAIHLAQLTYRRMRDRACPVHLDPEKWAYSLQVVDESLRQMQRYLEHPTEENADLVRAWLSDVRKLHDCYVHQVWGPVRSIDSTEVLLIAYALSYLLQPTVSADWGYRLARRYAERYDSRYGTGLIPESAPLVEDIADFWCQYHLGRSLQEWRNTASAS
jgi:hypothetical protein